MAFKKVFFYVYASFSQVKWNSLSYLFFYPAKRVSIIQPKQNP